MTLKLLREKRTKAVADMRAIVDAAHADNDRELTADETASYAALKKTADSLTETITREEDLESRELQLAGRRPAIAQLHQPRVPRGPEASTEFETFSDFLFAAMFRQNDQRLTGLWANFPADMNAMEMGTGSAGGFAVPTQFLAEVFKVSPQSAIVRPRARVIPAGTPPDSAITAPALDQSGAPPANMFGGVQLAWTAEGGLKNETDAKLREVTLTPHEVSGFVTVTDKLLTNWPAASVFIGDLLSSAKDAGEDYSFLQGNGNGKPLGAIVSPAAYAVKRTTAGQINYQDVANMMGRMLMKGGTAGPVWVASRSIHSKLLTMKNDLPGGDGSLVWQPNFRDAGGNQSLLGYPLLWNERSPTLGVRGDLSFDDFGYYLIKDGSGPFIAASPHPKFTENKTIIKIYWNVDGQPWLNAPLQDESGYATSPFVVLDIP